MGKHEGALASGALAASAERMGRIDTGLLMLERLTGAGLGLPLCDLVFGESGIYAFLPDGTLFKVAVYRAASEEREFRRSGLPCVHLFGCERLQEERENPHYRHRAVYRERNGFDLTVYSGRVEVKIYKDEPLPLCEACEEIKRRLYGPDAGDVGAFLKDNLIEGRFDARFDIDPEGTMQLPIEEWKHLTVRRRKMKGFHCEGCGVTLRGALAEFLDGHYVFNPRYGKDRLRLLCVACHAREEGHEALRESERYLRYREREAKKFGME